MRVLRTKLLFELFSGVSALCVLAVGLFFWIRLQPAGESGRVEVEIPKGASLKEIAQLLHERGVIKSAKAFEI
ncbi:MAG TPA: hypothetical protein ENF73_03210, partial [Proteobacteria bacterium]|nr:hypothetical protein [Pseudomonadota bacterium]